MVIAEANARSKHDTWASRDLFSVQGSRGSGAKARSPIAGGSAPGLKPKMTRVSICTQRQFSARDSGQRRKSELWERSSPPIPETTSAMAHSLALASRLSIRPGKPNPLSAVTVWSSTDP